VADAVQGADDFEAMAMSRMNEPMAGRPGKKIVRHLIAQHDDVTLLRFVEVVEPASQFHWRNRIPLYCGSAPVSCPLALANSLTACTSLVTRTGVRP